MPAPPLPESHAVVVGVVMRLLQWFLHSLACAAPVGRLPGLSLHVLHKLSPLSPESFAHKKKRWLKWTAPEQDVGENVEGPVASRSDRTADVPRGCVFETGCFSTLVLFSRNVFSVFSSVGLVFSKAAFYASM